MSHASGPDLIGADRFATQEKEREREERAANTEAHVGVRKLEHAEKEANTRNANKFVHREERVLLRIQVSFKNINRLVS
jgi:hypothetical protein